MITSGTLVAKNCGRFCAGETMDSSTAQQTGMVPKAAAFLKASGAGVFFIFKKESQPK